ncbi:MAG: Transcription termination protein NusB [Chloroflexi bacterium]|nr:Transcription termination protein NusB [Chloroflexota bacterium]
MSRGAGRRHRGRRLALRVLFELEGTTRDAVEALRYQAQDEAAPADVVAHAEELVYGTLRNLEAIDDAISAASLNWRLEDIGKVERAVLRLGTFELLYESGVPKAVAIDECIELGRTYAGDESAPFVNGVLGRIAGGGAE